MHAPRVAITILAAGGSTRMGQPKQLLPYRGRPLVAHATGTALASSCRPVVAVVGCEAERVRAAIGELPVEIIENPRWAEGLGTSIHAGVAAVQRLTPAADAVLLMLCDQPLVTAELLERMATTYRAGHAIVACAYGQTIGVPALFDRRFFAELLGLAPTEGAQRLLHAHRADAALVPFAAGNMDLDTPGDLARLREDVNVQDTKSTKTRRATREE